VQVGDLYHCEEHGLIVVRKVSLTHQTMNRSSLYKVVFHVASSGRLGYAQITREAFHERFTRL
jgi:hypothetical protein